MSKTTSKIPIFFALYIIIALFPQIFHFGGMLSLVWKIAVVLLLFLRIASAGLVYSMSSVGVKYMAFYILMRVICLFTNESVGIETILNIGIELLLLYFFLDTPIRDNRIVESNVLQFLNIYVFFIIISCLYNMVANYNVLLHLNTLSVYGKNATHSFFDNKNTFGVFLLFGSLAAMFLKVIEGKQRWLFAIILFLLNELMAMCRTAIILTLIILIISFLIGERDSFFKRLVFSVFLIIVCGVLCWFVPQIRRFLTNNVFGSTNSLDSRNGYLSKMIPLLRGVYLVFGYGDEKSIELAAEYAGNRYYHNTYLHILMSGGVLKFAFFIVIIIHSIIITYKVFKKDAKTGSLCFSAIMLYLIYSWVESVILFETPVIATLATIFVVSVPQFFYNAKINNTLLVGNDE